LSGGYVGDAAAAVRIPLVANSEPAFDEQTVHGAEARPVLLFVTFPPLNAPPPRKIVPALAHAGCHVQGITEKIERSAVDGRGGKRGVVVQGEHAETGVDEVVADRALEEERAGVSSRRHSGRCRP